MNINKPQKRFFPMKKDLALEICKECGAACCKLGGPDFTYYEREKVLNKNYPNFLVKLTPGHFELKSTDAICPYLKKDNSCSIHEERPSKCRSWPVYADYQDGKRIYSLVECPLTSLLSEEDIKLMIKQASNTPTKILINSFKISKLSPDEILLIEKRFNEFKINPLSKSKSLSNPIHYSQ